MRVTGDGSGPPAVAGRVAPAGEAFEGFARREYRGLVTFGWVLTGDFSLAEDLAQDALAAVWARWLTVGAYDRPAAWARLVVANRAVSARRRSGRERRALQRWAGRPEPVVELELPDDRFWSELRRLPPRQAQVLALHYLEDWGVAEVAAALGCAEATVRVHLHRGRLALASALGEHAEDDGEEAR